MNNLKLLRKQNGLTQRQLAAKARISRDYVARLESGERQNPSGVVKAAIAQALQVPMESLNTEEVEL